MKNLLKMFKYLNPYMGIFILTIFLSFIVSVFEMTAVWILGTLPQILLQTDTVEQLSAPAFSLSNINDFLKYYTLKVIYNSDGLSPLQMTAFFMVVLYTLKNILKYFNTNLNVIIFTGVVKDIRNSVYDHFIKMKITYHDRHDSGSLLAIMLNEIERVKTAITNTLKSTLENVFRLLITFTLLLAISWQMTLVIFVVFPLLILIIGKIGKAVKRRSTREFDAFNKLITSTVEVFNGIRIVRMFNAYSFEQNKMMVNNKHYTHTARRNERIKSIASPLTETITMYVSAGLLLFAGILISSGDSSLTGDDFMRFITILALSYQPIKNLGGINNTIQNGVVATERLFTFLDYPTEKLGSDSNTTISFEKSISLKNVSFKYPGTDSYVLNNISIDIQKGETVAIVGSSGAGKSTILDLIPLFYDIEEGHLAIDNTTVTENDVVPLRSMISVVTQDNFLFNTSVRENIAYPSVEIDNEKIESVARSANAHDFIMDLPEGYNTKVGERGITLSGGQKQRIAIARALYRNTPILIFDEATSALDTESEKLVQEAIDHVADKRTVIIVAHRLSTVKHADRIIVLHEGRIVEEGNHEELVQQNGRYKELCDMQFV